MLIKPVARDSSHGDTTVHPGNSYHYNTMHSRACRTHTSVGGQMLTPEKCTATAYLVRKVGICGRCTRDNLAQHQLRQQGRPKDSHSRHRAAKQAHRAPENALNTLLYCCSGWRGLLCCALVVGEVETSFGIVYNRTVNSTVVLLYSILHRTFVCRILSSNSFRF